MNHFIGTKQVTAQPMTRSDAEARLGRNVGGDKHGDGYLVEYEGGYQAWSPKDVFDAAYRPTTGMTFGLAIEALKAGKRVARSGWNGKGMWLFLIQGSNDIAKLHGYGFGEMMGEPTFRDAIFMKTVDNQLVPWTASQTDCLADDWQIFS